MRMNGSLGECIVFVYFGQSINYMPTFQKTRSLRNNMSISISKKIFCYAVVTLYSIPIMKL